jgi:hypothetical protein
VSLILENITDEYYCVLGSGVDGTGFNALLGYEFVLGCRAVANLLRCVRPTWLRAYFFFVSRQALGQCEQHNLFAGDRADVVMHVRIETPVAHELFQRGRDISMTAFAPVRRSRPFSGDSLVRCCSAASAPCKHHQQVAQDALDVFRTAP